MSSSVQAPPQLVATPRVKPVELQLASPHQDAITVSLALSAGAFGSATASSPVISRAPDESNVYALSQPFAGSAAACPGV
jgi:hypothetical protein